MNAPGAHDREPLSASSAGFTLPELMVAILLGCLLLGAALNIFVQARIAAQAAENLAALEERAAFAMTALAADIRLAGFAGHAGAGTPVAAATGIAVTCRGLDVTDWALNTDAGIEATDGGYGLPCQARRGPVAGSDTLVLRHADAVERTATSNRVRLQTRPAGSELLAPNTPAAADAATFDYAVHGWYLDEYSSETGLPALHRYTLVANGLLQNQEIMPGIEDFQVSLVIDSDTDGRPDGFVDPGTPGSYRVMAIRVWLLLRSATPEPGHFDPGPWRGIDADAGAGLMPNDGYRRIAADRTFWLRNAVSG